MKTKLLALLSALPLLAAPFVARADEPAAKPKTYPLKTCVVSDEKLGEMGDPYVFDYKGREVKLCCKSCKKDFDKDPAKYLKKLDDAAKNPPADKNKN